jgi:hypothetical protein
MKTIMKNLEVPVSLQDEKESNEDLEWFEITK